MIGVSYLFLGLVGYYFIQEYEEKRDDEMMVDGDTDHLPSSHNDDQQNKKIISSSHDQLSLLQNNDDDEMVVDGERDDGKMVDDKYHLINHLNSTDQPSSSHDQMVVDFTPKQIITSKVRKMRNERWWLIISVSQLTMSYNLI